MQTETNDPAQARKHVFLVDDHPLVRERLCQLIDREPDLAVCGEAEDGPQAFAAILEARPSAVVVDISLKSSHGLELIRDLQQQVPGLPILVLSMHKESLYALRALRAGALGYISKVEPSGEVLNALRRVIDGQVYLSVAMKERVVSGQVGRKQDTSDPVDRLSDRELEVFQFLGRGFGTRRIAVELHIGIKSVEAYRARLKAKLGASDATELLFHAIQWVHSLK